MVKKNLLKVFALILALAIVMMPFYLLRGYIVLGYKVANPDYSLIKSDSGVTSILVLGKGGQGHEAPDLTDSMINVFVSQNSNKISLLSIPRDIWVPEIRAKINSTYYWDKERGNQDYEFTRSAIEGVTGIRPSYIVVVDFNMFEDLVNALGGIEVNVENSFIDNKFPIPGKENDLCNGDRTYSCRYETVAFEKGIQQMNGETALKFVRSRNAEGDEGTDLARGARQQKVIEAIKNKLLSKKVLSNPKTMSQVFNSVSSNVETDMDEDSVIVLARLLFDLKDNIQDLVIPEEFFSVSQNSYKYDYQYVFIPKPGSWSGFQSWLSGKI